MFLYLLGSTSKIVLALSFHLFICGRKFRSQNIFQKGYQAKRCHFCDEMEKIEESLLIRNEKSNREATKGL